MTSILMRQSRDTDVRYRTHSNGVEQAEKPQLSDGALEELTALFKLLADDTRMRILYLLTQQPEMHVRALCNLLSQSQPAVSHHLALLKEAGLLDRRREGKHNYYALRTERITTLLDGFLALLPEHRLPWR